MTVSSKWKSALATHRKEILLVVPILFILVLFSFLMRYQGWREKNLSDRDMLVYYLGAESMIHDGVVMEKGDLSSYHSYQPPGTAYLVLPAVLLLKDARLFSLPGDLFLNILAMVFLYLIVRQCLGRGLALAVCVVFGFSRLVFMGLWPIGHPAYVLGMLWFLMQWINKRSTGWLFGALIILAFGLYADLAILPCLFIIPVLWILFRPPLRPLPIILAGAVALMIWFPYLRFETSNGFSDLRSIFSLQPISELGESTSQTPMYCYASLPGEMDSINETYIPFLGTPESMERVVFPEPGWEKYHRLCWLLSNLDRNFDGGYFLTMNPVMAAALWFLFLMGLFQTVGMALVHLEGKIHFIARVRTMNPKILIGVSLIGALALYGLINPGLLAMLSADGQVDRMTNLVVEQLRFYSPIIFSACCLGIFIGLRMQKRDMRDIAPLLVLWIPWLLLVIIAERTRSERFFWIWPLQVIFLVFAAWQMIEGIFNRPWLKWAVVVFLAVLVFPLSFYFPSIQGWMERGYSGEDNTQTHLVDFLHDELEAKGQDTIWLGYGLLSTYYGKQEPEDTRLRAGSYFDLILETRWGIRNMNQDPTGIDIRDEWRILESDNPSLSTPSPWEGFTAVKVFGPYVLFRAEKETASLAPSLLWCIPSFFPSPCERIYPQSLLLRFPFLWIRQPLI